MSNPSTTTRTSPPPGLERLGQHYRDQARIAALTRTNVELLAVVAGAVPAPTIENLNSRAFGASVHEATNNRIHENTDPRSFECNLRGACDQAKQSNTELLAALIRLEHVAGLLAADRDDGSALCHARAVIAKASRG